jgi:hypothetical protein
MHIFTGPFFLESVQLGGGLVSRGSPINSAQVGGH